MDADPTPPADVVIAAAAPRDPAPTPAHATASLHTTIVPEHTHAYCGARVLRALVKVRAVSSGGALDPAAVVLSVVSDRSGSMEGERIALLKEATEILVEDGDVTARDAIAVLSFNSACTVDAPLATMDVVGKARALAAIKGMKADGGTNIYGALDASLSAIAGGGAGGAASAAASPAAAAASVTPSSRAVLLFSDGRHNDHGGETATKASVTSRAREVGVPIHAIGIGSGHDASLLSSLASLTSGLYVSINNNETLSDAMAGLLSSLQTLVTGGATVILTLSPALIARGAVFHAPGFTSPFPVSISNAGTEATISIGRISSDECRTFCAAINCPSGLDDMTAAVADTASALVEGEHATKGGVGMSDPLSVFTAAVSFADARTGEVRASHPAELVTATTTATATPPFTLGFGGEAVALKVSADLARAATLSPRDAIAMLKATLSTIEQWCEWYSLTKESVADVTGDVRTALKDLEGNGSGSVFQTMASAYGMQTSALGMSAPEMQSARFRTAQAARKMSEFAYAKSTRRG